MSTGNLDYIQEKKISRTSKFRRNSANPKKNWNFRFQNFEKIDLIILPNRSNRSNRKKSLNRLDRFIGQRINTCMWVQDIVIIFLCVTSITYIETMQPRPFEEWIEKGHQRDSNLCGAHARPTNERSLVRRGEGYNQGSLYTLPRREWMWIPRHSPSSQRDELVT